MTHPVPGLPDPSAAAPIVALVGNPNVGKTTLFNRLCGERHHTSNFSGTTQEARVGDPRVIVDGASPRLVDLPGVYALDLDSSEARLARDSLDGRLAVRGLPERAPDLVLFVVDAANLERNLVLVGEVLARGHRGVVALNMTDEAGRRGRAIDAGRLAGHLGCPVVPTVARRGEGVDALRQAVAAALLEAAGAAPRHPEASPGGDADDAGRAVVVEPDAADDAAGAPVGEPAPRLSSPSRPAAADDLAAVRRWAGEVARDVTRRPGAPPEDAAAERPAGGGAAADEHPWTDRIDGVLSHPVGGLVVFALVMSGLFAVIFRLAAWPMEWLDMAFGTLGGLVADAMPDGLLEQFLVDGVIAGVGATVVFLPQICLLFFLLSLLEDTGYLSRAALVADRWMRPFGLSGHSFVPMLSAHACALPAIAAARGIPDARERLATILVTPFLSCTARIPVYVLLTGLLFPGRPLAQGLAFTGCYLLGAVAAIGSAILARRTVARGPRRPLSLELPTYRRPSLRTALLTTWDRGWGFLRKAGTVILLIAMVLWWLGTFPRSGPSPEGETLRIEAAAIVETAPERAAALEAEAEAADAAHAVSRTALGRIGGLAEPLFAPIGADRTLTVGILASFAAREVFVTTMAVQLAGREEMEEEGLLATLSGAERPDGTPLFDPATSWSLLVFYVLAMQCLPTLVMTAREAGGWRFAGLQLAWMTAVAWIAAFAVHRVAEVLLAGSGAEAADGANAHVAASIALAETLARSAAGLASAMSAAGIG